MSLPTNILPATSANDPILSHSNQHNLVNAAINNHEARLIVVEGSNTSEEVAIAINTANIATNTTNIATNASNITTETAARIAGDAAAIQRANHTGTQSADTLTDGTTNKAFLATERTKLAAITGTNTGDQTLNGLLPTQATNSGKVLGTDGTNTSWVAGGGGSGDMILASTQTVTGAKTFNAGTLLDKGSMVFNVKAYGAVGDGTTNDGPSINSALTAAQAVGGICYIPQGTYLINTQIAKDADNITIIGVGKGKTILKAGASLAFGNNIISIGNGSGPTARNNIHVQGITFDMNATTSTWGLSAAWCAHVVVRDCEFKNPSTTSYSMLYLGLFSNMSSAWNANDITIENCHFDYGSVSNSWEGITLGYARNIKVDKCTFLNKSSGVMLLNYNSEEVTVTNSRFNLAPFWINGRGPTHVDNCSFISTGIKIESGDNLDIQNSSFQGVTADATAGRTVGIDIRGFYIPVGATEYPFYVTLPYTWNPKSIVINGCAFDYPTPSAAFASYRTSNGVQVLDANDVTFSNNIVTNAQTKGVALLANYLTLVGNRVSKSAQFGIAGDKENYILAAKRGIFASNQSYDDQGTPTTIRDLVLSNELAAGLIPAQTWQVSSNDFNVSGSYSYYDSGFTTTKPAAITVNAVSTASTAFINIKDAPYNAKGDNSTDDTAAVQAALTACDTTGGTVYFPVGTYILGQLNISSMTTVMGTGISSKLKLKNTTNGFMFTTRDTVASPTGYPHDHQFRDLYFDLNMANNTTSAGAIISTKNRNAVVERCSFVNFKGNCVYFSGGSGNNVQPRFINNQFDMGDRTDGVGIKLDTGCYDSYIAANDIGRCWRGLILSNGGDGNHSVINNWTWANADCGIYLYQSHNNLLVNNTQDQNYGTTANGAGLCIDGCNNVAITNNKASNNSWRDVGNIMGFGVIGTVNINSGIRVFGGSTNIRIGNSIFSNPNGGQQYGIQAEGSSNVYYTNCTFTGQSTGNTNAITSATITSLDGGSSTWGGITGTLSSQTDLNAALGLKAPIASPTFTGVVTTPSLDLKTGSDASGTGGSPIPIEYNTGGYKHWIRTKHDTSTATNGIEFFLNTSGTSGGSSAPGTGNVQTLGLYGNGRVGIGTNSPLEQLDINGTSPSITLRYGAFPLSSFRMRADSFEWQLASNSGSDISPTWTDQIKVTNAGLVTLSDGGNLAVGTTTGTKIGTATTQKLGFFNATPVVRQTGNITTALTNLGLVATPTIAEADVTNLVTDLAAKQATLSLTTTGTSGAATLVGATLNIPSYAGGGSGITRTIATVTTTVTLGATALTDYVTFIGASGLVTLPTAVGNTNFYTLKNIDTTNKTISTTSSQTIDGSTTITLAPNASIDAVSDNANWRLI